MSIDTILAAGELEFTCPRHGPYTGIDLPMIQRHACVECLKEADALLDRAAREYDHDQRLFEGWRDHSGIPRRHQNRSVENWIPQGRGQELARKHVSAYADTLTTRVERGDGLLFLGPPGTGKTHLMVALATRAWMAGVEAHYAVWPEVLDTVKAGFGAGPEHPGRRLLEKLSRAQLLLLDELAVRAGSEYDQAALFDLVDYRYREGLPTLAASNATRETLPMIGERTADRLRECCFVVNVPGSSRREHAAADPALRDALPLIRPPEPRVIHVEITYDGTPEACERVYPKPDPYTRRTA